MKQLVDTGDIAALLNVGRAHVTDKLVKRKGFPKPVVDLSQRMRMWRADDVLKWVKSERRSRKATPGSKRPGAAANPGAR